MYSCILHVHVYEDQSSMIYITVHNTCISDSLHGIILYMYMYMYMYMYVLPVMNRINYLLIFYVELVV